MPIEFACQGCGTRYRVNDSLAGRSAKCRHCGEMMTVPQVSSSAGPKPPTPKSPESMSGIAFQDAPEPSAPVQSQQRSAQRPSHRPQPAPPPPPPQEDENEFGFKDREDEQGGYDASGGGDSSEANYGGDEETSPDEGGLPDLGPEPGAEVGAVFNEFA